jgi:hypothetical protein
LQSVSARSSIPYERIPPAGNTLIDDDGDSVFIRICPDRSVGRLASWGFILVGSVVTIFIIADNTGLSRIGILRAIPLISAAILLFVVAWVMRFGGRTTNTTILASPEGIEFTTSEFAPRMIERAKIQRVFTRDTPLAKGLSLGLKLIDESDVVLGAGTAKEIEAMARAIHRVLNEQRSREPEASSQ